MEEGLIGTRCSLGRHWQLIAAGALGVIVLIGLAIGDCLCSRDHFIHMIMCVTLVKSSELKNNMRHEAGECIGK